jgi:hypothetical protein
VIKVKEWRIGIRKVFRIGSSNYRRGGNHGTCGVDERDTLSKRP